MTIVNNASHNVAFKVKTTAPKFYCVRPNAAVIAPGESVEIQVIFLGLSEEPAANYNCRDKFLVITLPAPEDLDDKGVADAWSKLEASRGKEAVSKKIKVRYVTSDEISPAVAKQDVEESVEVEKEEKQAQPLSQDTPAVEKEEKTTEATEEINEKKAVSSEDGSNSSENKQDSSVNLKLLLGIVLIAFIFRWLYNWLSHFALYIMM